MKKTLLLLLASVALLSGCKKDDQPVDNSILLGEFVKEEVTCPACGAGYTVVCKNPWARLGRMLEQTWNPVDESSIIWELKNSTGEYVRFYERGDRSQIKFTCACGREMGPFSISDFRNK